MAELKPCPFCGGTKVKVESRGKLAGWTGIDAIVERITYSVRCNVCHARGSTAGGKVIVSHKHVYQDHMPDWAVTEDALEAEAIDAWNRRADNG